MKASSWRALQIMFLICPLLASFSAFAKKDKPVASFATRHYDNVKYRWTGAKRIVSIADLHGSFGVLEQTLAGAHLIDKDGNWSPQIEDENGNWIPQEGGGIHLDFLGDYIDGGPDGAMIYSYLRILQAQAKAAGSFVHVPPGNHDILAQAGHDPHQTQAELQEFGDEEHANIKFDENIQQVMRTNSGLAKWLAESNAIDLVKMEGGPTFGFVHGGLNPREIPASPGIIGRIDSTVRAWQRFWLLGGKRPKRKTSGIVGMYTDGTFSHGDGPFFTRINKWDETELGAASDGKVVDDTPTKEEMNAYLDALGIDILFVGHAPTRTSQIGPHPRWGNRVWVLDIAQSEAFGDKGNVGFVDVRREPSLTKPGKFVVKILPKELSRVKMPNRALYDKIKAMTESDVQAAILVAHSPACVGAVGKF